MNGADNRSSGLLLWWSVWPVLLSGLLLYGYGALGQRYLEDYALDLGSQTVPTVREAYQFMIWTAISGVAAPMMALTFLRFSSISKIPSQLVDRFIKLSDIVWIVGGTLLSILAAVLIRHEILRGAPLTDDESAYQFASELLAMGKLRVESPPVKLLFDRNFMINDGHLYPLYFLGWPALMLPGTLLGVPGYMGAVYHGLTVPPLFLTVRTLLGGKWARLAVVVFIGSPMLMMSAATQMSHAPCTFAIAWMTWFLLRTQETKPAGWTHAALATACSVAVFIRPQSALPFVATFVGWWAVGVLRSPGRSAALAGFSIPAAVGSFLFLAVNKIQNGSWFKVGYVRELEYCAENKFRFTYWSKDRASRYAVSHLVKQRPFAESLANTVSALLRLNATAFGWPSSFLFAAFSGMGRWQKALWLSFLVYLGFHFFVSAPGIDSFGPAHYLELGWPIVLLTVFGVHRLTQWTTELDSHRPDRRLRPFPLALCLALVVLSASHYLPLRLRTLSLIADDVLSPLEAARTAGIHNAIIFAPHPFTPRPFGCEPRYPLHWVFCRPNNDPQLKNDILWVNQVSPESHRKLLRHFPHRKGYLMVYHRCKIRFLPVSRDGSPVDDPRCKLAP